MKRLIGLLVLLLVVSGCEVQRTELDVMLDKQEMRMEEYAKIFRQQQKNKDLLSAQQTMMQAGMDMNAFSEEWAGALEKIDQRTLKKIRPRLDRKMKQLIAKLSEMFKLEYRKTPQ